MDRKILKKHACGFNDGEHVCECFVAGREAGKLEGRTSLLDEIEKWSGVLPTYMMSGGSVPFINIK